jgi:hypothetical protein
MSCTQHSEVSGFGVCEVKLLHHTLPGNKEKMVSGFRVWAGSRSDYGLLSIGQTTSKGSKDERYCQDMNVHIRQRNDESEMSRNANSPVPWFVPSEHHKKPDTRATSSCLGDETGIALTNISIYDVKRETWQARTTIRSTVSQWPISIFGHLIHRSTPLFLLKAAQELCTRHSTFSSKDSRHLFHLLVNH